MLNSFEFATLLNVLEISSATGANDLLISDATSDAEFIRLSAPGISSTSSVILGTLTVLILSVIPPTEVSNIFMPGSIAVFKLANNVVKSLLSSVPGANCSLSAFILGLTLLNVFVPNPIFVLNVELKLSKLAPPNKPFALLTILPPMFKPKLEPKDGIENGLLVFAPLL